jgi:hypothetical protein
MVSIVNLVELIRVRKNRIGRHLLCYKFSLSNDMGRAQRSHLLLLPKAENGLVAETLSPAAVLLWQRHPLVAGLLFSDLGAVGINHFCQSRLQFKFIHLLNVSNE